MQDRTPEAQSDELGQINNMSADNSSVEFRGLLQIRDSGQESSPAIPPLNYESQNNFIHPTNDEEIYIFDSNPVHHN